MIELLPKPNLNKFIYKKVYDFAEEKAQGLTFGPQNSIFLSSKANIFKFTLSHGNLYENPGFNLVKSNSLSNMLTQIRLNARDYDHIGDVDFFEGLLFVPVRNRSRENNLLIVLSSELEIIGFAHLPNVVSDSCCAVNPWNRHLFIESKKDSRYLLMLDISYFYKVSSYKKAWGQKGEVGLISKKFWFTDKNGTDYEPVYSIQGLAFSQNGRLYLTRNSGRGPWMNYIHVYNAKTGLLLDKTESDINFPGSYDEIEGISVHPSGIIYIAVLLHNNLESDRFQIFAFKYADPRFPV